MVNYTTTNKSEIRTTALQFMYLTKIYSDYVKLNSRHNETNTALSGETTRKHILNCSQ